MQWTTPSPPLTAILVSWSKSHPEHSLKILSLIIIIISYYHYLNSSEDLMGAMLLKMLHYLPKGRLLTVCLVANQ